MRNREQPLFWKQPPALLAVVLTVALSLMGRVVRVAADEDSPSPGVSSTSAPSSISSLLPPSVSTFSATSDVKQVSNDNLYDLVGEEAAVYKEYRVVAGSSRQYARLRADARSPAASSQVRGSVRVDVFQTETPFAAYGLFSFIAGTKKGQFARQELGPGSARVGSHLVFWKRNFLVRIGDTTLGPSLGGWADYVSLARAISDTIAPGSSGTTHPPLLDSLPSSSIVSGSETYFLGPESLGSRLAHAREMFPFEGDTEAVMAQYSQGESAEPSTLALNQLGVKSGDDTASSSSLSLAIVEYHTPQFATDAMARVTSYLSSLPDDAQQHIIVKRTGNYIVEAANVRDREFAEGLVNSVAYPYTVKWLRNPLWPTNDPFRTQKAAEMLLSTFGLLGLILLTVLGVGTVFGTTIFLKRRKRQQEIFSDAGGMLRLDIDSFESVILGLPPKRSEE